MKIHGMLMDSAKYPLLNLKSFLSLGFMILISSFLLSQYFDFKEFFGVKLSDSISLVVILLAFLILSIATILESGYTFKIIEKSLTGIKKPPEMNNFIPMFKHGINEIIIFIIYSAVPIIIFLMIVDALSTQINFGLPGLSENIIILLIILLAFLFFISNILFTVAIPYMAFKGGSFKEAFKIIDILRKIKQIGLKELVIGYLIVVLGLVAIGWPVLEEIIESANIIGFVIAELIIAPYIVIFSARFTALIYKSHLSP
ncbi:DUF4013 domain-containing protein [Methanobacterium sp.]|jgi:hypothetical protein|uniref:DUF4013 domain-containing protein n=1 Tax=Methanobacterium sp. TaxID=2164 RepID=UPI003157FA0E